MRRLLSASFCFSLLTGSVALATEANYDKHCKSCHGADGSGNPDRAKMLKLEPEKLNLGRAETAGMSKDDAKKVIADGKGKMPGYAKKLSAEEIDGVTEHTWKLIEALRAKK